MISTQLESGTLSSFPPSFETLHMYAINPICAEIIYGSQHAYPLAVSTVLIERAERVQIPLSNVEELSTTRDSRAGSVRVRPALRVCAIRSVGQTRMNSYIVTCRPTERRAIVS